MCEEHDCPIKNKIIKKGLEETIRTLQKDDSISHVRKSLISVITMLSSKTSCQTTNYLIERCKEVSQNLDGFTVTTINDDRRINVFIDELKVFIDEN